MKKTFKKILSIMLVLIMLPLSNTSVFAETSGESGIYKYTLCKGTDGSGNTTEWVEINGYTQHITGDLVIPVLINNVPVTKITENAFSNCHGITSLSIPSGVGVIGKGAFSNCYSITDVVVCDGNSEYCLDIEESAFSGCFGMKSITLPVKKCFVIRDMTFSGCSSLTDIYYKGTKEQYNNCDISIYDYNTNFSNAEIFYVDSVREIKLNKTTISLIKNNSAKLIPTITPSDASNKTIIWTSSDMNIATVSSDGVVKGVGVGTTTITATTQDKNNVATCVVTVTENIEEDILGEGDGTASNPYKIDSEENLQIVSDIPNAHYKLIDDIELTDTFTPLCSLKGEFTGIFDGNGHTISNLAVTDYYEFSGLFGKNSGTIKNLNVIYSSDGAKYDFSKVTNFGVIAGYNDGNIINCMVDLSANITDSTSSAYIINIGGITGQNATNGNIEKCSVDGEIIVNATSNSSNTKSIYIGGISGKTLNSIENCDANVSVTQNITTDGYVSVDSYIGGISASGTGTIKNSNAIYNITVGQASNTYIGGVIGTGSTYNIENVSADGEIYSTSNLVYVGGIVGKDFSSNTSTITNAKTKIIAEISEILSSSYLGGVAGYLNSTAIVQKSGANADFKITKTKNQTIYPEIHCGGLVGTTSGQIEDCYATGIINSNISSSSTYSGGIVGGISGATPKINNSYAAVSGVKYGLSYPGGTVENSFYDSTVSGCNDTGYGSPTATISMKMKSIYSNAGWNLDDVWDISPSINNGYPHLRTLVDSSVIKVSGLLLDKSALTMNIGESETITATISPSNATNKSVVWTSSNPNVVAVSNGIVTAVSPGNATITAKTEDGNYTAICIVTVSAPTLEKVSTPKANVSSGSIDAGTTITLSTETEGATIYYTTDGSTPTTTSTEYTEAIAISTNTTIKAVAVKENMENSSVATFTYTVLNDDMATISISDGKGKSGDTINLTLDIANNPGIAGMILRLSYDEGLTLTNIATGDALPDLMFTPPANVSKNPCTLLWDGITADATNGTVLTFTFEIAETAPEGEYNVSVSYTAGDIYDDNTQDIDVQIVNGVVTVYKYKTGDVNEDEVINAKDITMLRKFISGDYGVTINEDAADVNKDGILNAKDITILRKYISGDYGIVLD